MRTVSRSALVPYSAQQMFALVEDVEAYPSFLPWCSDARVDWQDGNRVEASIEMHRAGARHSFSTRNTLRPGESIEMSLLSGPFRQLSGDWQFKDLDGAGCKVTLELEFEFSSRMLDSLLGSFFEQTCAAMVDAFTRRADDIYGGANDDLPGNG